MRDNCSAAPRLQHCVEITSVSFTVSVSKVIVSVSFSFRLILKTSVSVFVSVSNTNCLVSAEAVSDPTLLHILICFLTVNTTFQCLLKILMVNATCQTVKETCILRVSLMGLIQPDRFYVKLRPHVLKLELPPCAVRKYKSIYRFFTM